MGKNARDVLVDAYGPDDADDILALLNEVGLAIVPREPTEAMHQAGHDMHWDHNTGHSDVWEAMLAAAPKP